MLNKYSHILSTRTPKTEGGYAALRLVLKIIILCFMLTQTTGVAGASSLTEVGSYDTSGYAQSTTVSGKYAYVADYYNLMIIDISNPANPVLAGSYTTAGNAWDVAVSGSYAYVADDANGLLVIDISYPAAPVLVGRYNTAGIAWSVAVSGSYAYVADDTNGLLVIGISNPAAPVLVGSFNTAGYAKGVTLSGNYAYVGDYSQGFAIIDISNPANPVLAGSSNTAGTSWNIAVSGSYAYVADDTNGFLIFDVTNPATPILVGRYNTAGSARNVVISGSYAYVADDGTGLLIIDISNSASPTLAGSFDTAGRSLGVTISDNYAYVADYTNGLVILGVSGSISVSSSPSGASVYLDGAYKGTTPYTIISVSEGNHTIKLTKPRYVDKTKTVNVVSGGTTSVSETLALIPPSTGSISVSSSPSGASVYLDGVYKGTTPYTITSVSAGSHTTKLTKSGYVDKTTTVNVVGGGTTSISETLTLIPPSTGSISVSSSPSGASVYLDGVYKGTTPFTISSVSAGSHTIKLTKSGYIDKVMKINIVTNRTTSISETLALIPPSTGSISISSNPSGAEVYLDDEYKGTTPLAIESISIGSHALKLLKDGYSERTKSIIITKDRMEKVSISLESIEVTAMESTNSIDTNALETDNKKSDAALVPVTKSDKSSSNIFETSLYVGIGTSIILLLLAFIATSGKKSKPKNRPISTHVKQCANHTKKSATAICHKCDKLLCNDCTLHHRDGHPYCKDCWNNLVSTKKGSTAPKKSALSSLNKSSETTPSVNKAEIKDSLNLPIVEPKPAQQNTVTPPAPVQSNATPTITSAFGYKGATIQYKVKVENPTSEPIADIKVNLYVPDVFLASESTKSIAMLKPSESKTATFEIRPTGECGDCEVSGKVVYYDYSTKKTTGMDIPPKSLSIVCPMLKGKEIDESEWHSIVSNLIETEESTREIDMPAETLFTMTSRIVKDMHMHRLEPEITNTQQLFNGVARFYGEGVKGLKYAAQVEVVGGAKKSRLILKTWAEKEEALTGFYHGLLDEIEKRVSVKGYIDDSIVQNFYHNGDNIGTQVNDSIVQRSNIGAGADVAEKKCPTCGTVAEGNGKYCNGCGGKL